MGLGKGLGGEGTRGFWKHLGLKERKITVRPSLLSWSPVNGLSLECLQIPELAGAEQVHSPDPSPSLCGGLVFPAHSWAHCSPERASNLGRVTQESQTE